MPTVKSGPQIITYTGKSTMDGLGSTVAGEALSPGTPSAAVVAATAGNLSEGAYQYQAAFVLPAGESEVSAASSSATITGISSPSAPSGAQTSGVSGNLTVGDYGYKVAYRTAAGRSAASSASSGVAIADISAPSAPSGVVVSAVSGHLRAGTYLYKETGITAAGETVASSPSTGVAVSDVGAPTAPSVALLSGLGHLVGAYGYKASLVGSYGETLPGSVGSRTAVAVSAPVAPSRSQVSDTIGLLGLGDYLWKASFVTPDGETLLGSATSSLTLVSNLTPSWTITANAIAGGNLDASSTYLYGVTFVTAEGDESTGANASSGAGTGATNLSLELSGIPTGPVGIVARRLYRTVGNGSQRKFLAEIPDNASINYFDSLPDTALGVNMPTTGAIKGKVSITSIPTGPTGTLARRLFRTKVGGSEYFLVSQISDNSTTSHTDNTPDNALTDGPTLVATAGGEQHTVTFSTGPSGTTARRLWRTDAGGTLYRLLAEIPDNSTTTFADNTSDALLGGSPPNISTAVGGQITVTIPVHSDARVVKRNVYRTEVNGSTYYLLTTINDNNDTSFTDNIADELLGGISPATGSAGTGRITVTIPVSSDARVTGRVIFRKLSTDTDYRKVATVGDNTSTTHDDNVATANLGDPEQAETTAGAGTGQIAVSAVPIGPAGTTDRVIYRTEAGGTVFRFLRALTGNVSTSFTDNAADSSLGEAAPVGSTVGALAGATSLRVKDLALHPADGWVRVGEQLVRYTGRSGSSGEGTLTGIPASGAGAIGAGIAANVSAVNHPHLTGVSGILYPIKQGDPVNIWVTRNDTAAQAFMAAAVGGDGIHEADPIQDRRMSETEITARCDAKLQELTLPIVTVRYQTRDITTRSGRKVTVTLGAPTNILGTFKIQSVTTNSYHALGTHRPWKQVECSSRMLTFEQILRIRKAT